jgi:hypothetical protein
MADTEYEQQLEKDIDILRGEYTPPVGDKEYKNISVDPNGNIIIEEQ